jgi:hypothetical protein
LVAGEKKVRSSFDSSDSEGSGSSGSTSTLGIQVRSLLLLLEL